MKNRLPFRGIVAVAVSLAMILASSPDVWAAKDPKKAKKEKPPRKCEVYGQVFEADGKTPVAGATVHFRWLEGKDTLDSKPTDKKGRFTIGGLDYGWAELAVETPQGNFVSDQALELLPGGRAAIDFSLTRFTDRPPDYWVVRNAAGVAPGADGAAGLAETKAVLAGKDFWKSPKGIAIIAGVTGAVLLGIAASTKKRPTTATPVGIPPTTP